MLLKTIKIILLAIVHIWGWSFVFKGFNMYYVEYVLANMLFGLAVVCLSACFILKEVLK